MTRVNTKWVLRAFAAMCFAVLLSASASRAEAQEDKKEKKTKARCARGC